MDLISFLFFPRAAPFIPFKNVLMEWRQSKAGSTAAQQLNQSNQFNKWSLLIDDWWVCWFCCCCCAIRQSTSLFSFFNERRKVGWWRCLLAASRRCFGCSIQSKTFTFWFHCSTKSNYFYNSWWNQQSSLLFLFNQINQIHQSPPSWSVRLIGLLVAFFCFWISGLWAGGSSAAKEFHSINSINSIPSFLPSFLLLKRREVKRLLNCFIDWLKLNGM